jgi:hypothetical protein
VNAVTHFHAGAPAKRERAKEVVDGEGPRRKLVVGAQVLQESFVGATRKLEVPLPADEALVATRRHPSA